MKPESNNKRPSHCLARLVRPLGHTGGSDYGRAVMDRNAAEELAREAYKNGDMKLRDEMLEEYRAAKERVKILQPNAEPIDRPS